MKTAPLKRYFNWWMYGQDFFHSALVAKSPRSYRELLELWIAIEKRNGISRLVTGAFRECSHAMIKSGQIRLETVPNPNNTPFEGLMAHKSGDLSASEWMAAEIKAVEANACFTGAGTASRARSVGQEVDRG